jgi:alpha-mannosidase
VSSHRNYRIQRLNQRLSIVGGQVIRETTPATRIHLRHPSAPSFGPPPDSGAWTPIGVGGRWGQKQGWAFFRAIAAVPDHWEGGAIEVRLRNTAGYLEPPQDDNYPAGPEGQLFVNGKRVGAIDARHHRIRHPFTAGETYDLRAVLFAGRCACRHTLEEFELAWIDQSTEKLYHDLRVVLMVIEQLEEASLGRQELLRAVHAAVQELDLRRALPGQFSRRFYASVTAAQQAFDSAMASLEPAESVPQVAALGHAHIDMAWLWPLQQTRHKCVRTFATQLRLLDQFPGWTFLQSSPQAYAWVQEDAPGLFQKIKESITAGRWEAEGAMWVEPDTNLPSGESLVRQLLYGKRYLRDELGVDSRLLWLPDTFGYSAALPQLLALAGIEGFVSGKMSWSQVNRFPHDTFRWRGIDGSQVLTHFITTPSHPWPTTYSARLTAAETKGIWRSYRHQPQQLEPLMTFGYGNGGGGPTEEMLETGSRLANMPAVAGMPKLVWGTARALLQRITSHAEELPVWDGELYLEYHRGTYTSQGWLKRANRKNEVRLHNLEWLASLAAGHGYRVERKQLDQLWQDLLLMQFHDILPGSSVGEVYDEVRPMQERIAARAGALTDEAASFLCREIDTTGFQQPVVLLNTLSWERREPVLLPDGSWRDDVAVPAGGWAVVEAAAPPAGGRQGELILEDDGRRLSNRYWRLRLDQQGRIVELYDRLNDRPVLPAGAVANEWQLFEDRPADFDAWNIDPEYEQHRLPGPECTSIRVVEAGAVRGAVEVQWVFPPIGEGPTSAITQRVVLYATSPRIDFETQVGWHEHHQLLKAAFPIQVRATEATYQIQFGHLSRPTHRNTSWDLARYELCAHQFVDLSEHNYGVALLNDCKYGHDVHDGVIRLTCLKSPRSPHAQADQGLHQFTYALLPHSGLFQEAGVIRAAAELNVPLIAVPVAPSPGSLPPSLAFVQSDTPAAVVETLKPAEDGDGLILRLYESHGSHVRATLSLAYAPRSVQTVDLLEQPLDPETAVEQDAARVRLYLRPFQVLTLRLRI